MMKNVSYALPLLGKFSRVDAMSHWYKATEICREKKKKAAEHTLFIYDFLFLETTLHIHANFLLKTRKRNTNMVTNKVTPI